MSPSLAAWRKLGRPMMRLHQGRAIAEALLLSNAQGFYDCHKEVGMAVASSKSKAFVSERAVRTANTELRTASRKSDSVAYRSAQTGQFISHKTASRIPATTVVESRRVNMKKK